MIDGGNGLTSWFFCLRKKQAYHVWGPLPLYSLTQLAESKVTLSSYNECKLRTKRANQYYFTVL